MSLVWHIVRKDFRRLRLPLALWLVLVLAHTALLASNLGGNQANPGSFEGLRYFANTWGVIVSAVGFVLAAWLVMEDSLVITQAFWPTRPISGARLLAAKVLGAFLMFGVGPALILAPVWLGCGFSLEQAARAAGALATPQVMLSAWAMAIAGVTATSGQFLVRAVASVIIVQVGTAVALGKLFPSGRAVAAGVVESRTWLVVAVLIVTTLAMIGHQYLTRRTLRTWTLAGLGLGLVIAVRFVWFWDVTPLVRSEAKRSGMDQPEIRSVAVGNPQLDLAPSLTRDGHAQFSLRGAMTAAPVQSYLRVNASLGEWAKGHERLALKSLLRAPGGSGRPPEVLARQIAGLPAPGQVPDRWSLAGDEPDDRVEQARTEGRTLQVSLNLTLMRGRVLGELPLRVGAELHSGATRTRIIGLERTNAGVLVRLQDRDCQIYRAGLADIGRLRQPEDVFVLVHGPTGFDQVPAQREIGAVQINSILVGQRELTLIPPTRTVNGQTEEIPGWEDESVIIEVRFQPERTFIRDLTLDPFAPAPGR